MKDSFVDKLKRASDRHYWYAGAGLFAVILLVVMVTPMGRYIGVSLYGVGVEAGQYFSPLVGHVTGETPDSIFCYDNGSSYCEAQDQFSDMTRLGTMGYLAIKRPYGVETEPLYSCRSRANDNFKISVGSAEEQGKCSGKYSRPYLLGYIFSNDKVDGATPLFRCTAQDNGNDWLTMYPDGCSNPMHNGRYEQPEMIGYLANSAVLASTFKGMCKLMPNMPECRIPGLLPTTTPVYPSVSPIVPDPYSSNTPDPYTPYSSPSPLVSMLPPSPTPSPAVSPVAKEHTVFVTKNRFMVTGDRAVNGFTGLTEADGLCGEEANVAYGLMGAVTYKAILSDSTTDAKDRIEIVGPVKNLEGEIVANNAEEFWSGSLQNAVRDKVTGVITNVFSWTGTSADGTGYGTTARDYCGDWTEATWTPVRAGNNVTSNSRWLNARNISCRAAFPLYCISQ